MKSSTILVILLLSCNFFSYSQRSLDYFLQQAGENNPVIKVDSLQALANSIESSRQKTALSGPLVYTEIGFLLSPVVATDHGETSFKLNPSKNLSSYYGYDLAITNGGLYRGLLAVDQPLFNGPKLAAVDHQNEVQNALLENHRRLTLHELEKVITDQYLLCSYSLRQQAVLTGLIEALNEQAAVTKKLAAQALLNGADVQLLNIEIGQLQTALSVDRSDYRAQLLELYTLCGIKDTASVVLPGISLVLRDSKKDLSGFTEQFRLDSLSQEVFRESFNLRYKPQVSLYSSAGLNTVYASDIPRRIGWQAGLRLTKTIFDGRQRDLIDKRSKILQETTGLQTDYFNAQNQVRKEKIRQQLAAIDEQEAALQKQQEEYAALLDYYKSQVIR